MFRLVIASLHSILVILKSILDALLSFCYEQSVLLVHSECRVIFILPYATKEKEEKEEKGNRSKLCVTECEWTFFIAGEN